MARVKRTARGTTPLTVITWTRFRLPPNQEWPIWPSTVTGPATAREMFTGPLANVRGVSRASVGRMVDDPWQAVYMIVWYERKYLDQFLASPAPAEFLRNLPEVDHHEDSPDGSRTSIGIEPALGSLSLDDQSSSPSSPILTHPRFLILDQFHWCPSAVKQRVTMTAFLIPGDKDDKESLRASAKSLEDVFGDERGRPYYISWRHRGGVLWRHHTLWCYGSAAPADHSDSGGFGRLERTLLGHSPSPLENKDDHGDSQTLICEFLMWHLFEDPKGDEEEVANDLEFRGKWEEKAKSMKAKGMVTAWRKERWDFRLVPKWYGEDSGEEEEE